MKKKFTFLVAALALLAMFVQPLKAVGQTKSEVDDEMTASSFAATSTSYTAFTGVSITSDAVYAGKTAKSSNGGIQLRSSGSDCGIISTGSGGLVRKVSVEWESGTSNGRSLDIYGKNSAYSSASELYNANNQGTKLGSIVKGTSTELTITGDYEFIGMRSYNGAMYLTSITVTWETGGSSDSPSISAENVDIDYNATSGAIEYTINNPASGGVLTATTESNWLSIGTIGETVPFTCSANEGLIRTAQITLTYTYGNDNVTKNVTVTQAANPNGPGSLNNPYTVAQARAAIDAGTGTQGVYATGIVSQIVTEYNSSWGNLTFNIVDQSGDEVFLQAYRCGGDEAQNVAVNDIVIVYGNLKLYQSNTETTYEFDSGCQVVSLEHPAVAVAAPTFSIEDGVYEEAQTVTLSCETDGASIYYTVDGTVPTNASTPYTTAINVETTTTIKAIAYVGEESSTVASATYTIIPVVNISSITEVGTTYLVRGTVVATNSRGFVMGDGTGYVYYYKGSAVDQSVGAMVKVYGTTGTYGQIIQFTNSATVTEATASNYNGTPEATLITEVPDYTQGYHLSTYLEFEGALAKSNSNYFITLGESQIQISYPTTDQGTALTALDGKNVHVKGYFTGINSSSKFSVMLESAEEVVVTEPTITVADATVNVPFDGGEGTLTVTYENITEVVADVWFCNAEGTADATYDWITAEINNNNNVDYLVEPNEGEARTAYFKVWAYDDDLNEVYSNLVTVTQAEYVAPTYAELPFEFVGGLAAIEDTDGLYQDGLGSDYSSAPKLKFNDTGDWLLLQFSERPGTLTFDIKGYSFSGGTFTVQTSEDGVTFTNLQNYTDDNFGNSLYSEEFTDLGENVRYIKWIYTEKSGGNVGLGNIALAAYVPPVPTITIDPPAIDAPAEGASGSLSMTLQAIVNNAVEIQWFDEDGETPAEYDHDWIVITSSATSLGYTIEANASTMERTAHFRAVGNNNSVLSELVNVTQAAAEVPQPTVTVTPAVTDLESAATSGSLDVTMTNLEAANIVAATFEFYHFDGETYTVFGEEEDDPNWLGLECGFEYSVITYSVLENTADEARSAYFKLIIESNRQDYVYSDMVTINQAAYVPAPPTADSWVLTDLADLTENDIFVIVGTVPGENTYALPNNATSAAPAAVSITIANGALSDEPATELQWNISGNATDGYTFYPNGDTENWLYCTNTNNGVRVGTNENKVFTVNNDYLYNTATSRHVGVYNAQDWRCYAPQSGNVHSNIAGETFAFYKKVSAPAPTEPTVTVEPSSIAATAEGLEGNLVVTYANYDNPDNILAEVWFCDENGENAVEYDWIDAEIDDEDVTNIYYMIDANAGEARIAYFKVFEASEDIYSELVTVTQEAYVPTPTVVTYSLVTDASQIVSGKHYIIASGIDGDVKAMGGQQTNNRAIVAVTAANNTIEAVDGLYEFVINGPQTIEEVPYFTIYDTEAKSTGYLYAAGAGGSGSNNHLKTRTTNASDDKGIWTIAFEGNKAIIEAKASGRNKIRYNANSSCFSCYATGQADVYLFVKDNDTDYEYYGCEITYSGENIPADETITVGAGAVMEFTNTFTNTDPANIIVEDGGQLVINSSNVAATVKKDIVGHNPNGKDGVNGYYLVSSPIGNVNPSAVGMTTGSYDLYKFDQSQDLEWVNYKSDVIDGGQFDLVSGQGYLYANNENETLEFAGTIYNGDGKVTLTLDNTSAFAGWNLVGNPFTQDAYINRSYYVMNSTGSEILADMVSQDNPIKPMQGIFVIANEDDEEMTFFKEPQSSSNNGGLTLNVSQMVSNRGENSSSLVDRAIVRFGDNDMLPKFQLNDNSTKVYIPMNGKDYAVVSSEAQGEMPVNFKAAENGTYTFSVDAAENDMSYLHLIDHLTGANVDLLATPSYTFEARDTDMVARFKLVFSGNNAGTSDNFAFISDGQIILGGVDGNSIVSVIDINGRILTSSRGTSSIATDHMPAGVYVLQLVNGNEVKTQKIIVK